MICVPVSRNEARTISVVAASLMKSIDMCSSTSAPERRKFGSDLTCVRADGQGGEIGWGHPESEESADDRSGGRADDDACVASVPTQIVLEGRECSCVVGGADGATPAEH